MKVKLFGADQERVKHLLNILDPYAVLFILDHISCFNCGEQVGSDRMENLLLIAEILFSKPSLARSQAIKSVIISNRSTVWIYLLDLFGI